MLRWAGVIVFVFLLGVHLLLTEFALEFGCNCSGGCSYSGGGLEEPLYTGANAALFVIFCACTWLGLAKRHTAILGLALACPVLSSFTDFGEYTSAFCASPSQSAFLYRVEDGGARYRYWSSYQGAPPRQSILNP